MMTLPIGLFLSVIVAVIAVREQNLAVFLNFHSFGIVIVGTLAVFALSTPYTTLMALLAQVRGLVSRDVPREKVRVDLLALSKNRDAKLLDPHPLIAKAQELWEQGTDPTFFRLLLAQKMGDLNSSTEKGVSCVRSLAKYPPALGMTGTVVGLISLFSNLSEGNREQIGPHLAMAMTATFYGLIVANALLMPLADRLSAARMIELTLNEQVFQVLLLVNAGEPASMLEGRENATAA